MKMSETPLSERIPIEEFVKLPYVIELYAKDYPSLESRLKGIPYVRMGKRVRGDYGVLFADSRRIGDLITIVGTFIVELFPHALGLLGRTSLLASGITQVQQIPFLDLRGHGTLIGIIDTGIDYTNDAFRYEDGASKISFIWDQTIEGNSPNGFLFGSEYTKEQINQALRSDTPGRGTMTGTSVAAAITAGACALLLQWGIVQKNDVSLNTFRIKAFLIRGCKRDQNTKYPSFQWGYGILDLFNTFNQMRS